MAMQKSGPRRAAGSDLIPSESGDRGAATGVLSWHLVSAGVIALMATGFLALLDAQPLGGGEVSQDTARRADVAGDPAAVARSAAEKLRPPAARAERVVAKPQQAAAPPAPEAPKPRAQEVRVPEAGVAEARAPEARRPEAIRPPAADMAAPRAASAAPAAPAAVVASMAPPPRASPAVAPGLPSFAREGAAIPFAPSTPRAAAEPVATASIDSPAGKASAPAAAEKAPSSRLVAGAGAPLQCLPAELKSVLNDVAERFGTTTVVSTTHLHTDNHSPGSARAKMHPNCKAVDFKVGSEVKAVTAYLRTRKEVAGINSYRNGVIHIDVNPNFKSVSKPADKTGKSASR